MNEEKKKPKTISEKDAVQEAGVKETVEEESKETAESKNENTKEAEKQLVETSETSKTSEKEEKKPRVKVVVEPVFGERGTKPVITVTSEKPRLVREVEEQAARDVLPTQSPPGTPLEARKPLTREEVVEKAKQVWEENKRKKSEGKFFNRLKRALKLG